MGCYFGDRERLLWCESSQCTTRICVCASAWARTRACSCAIKACASVCACACASRSEVALHSASRWCTFFTCGNTAPSRAAWAGTMSLGDFVARDTFSDACGDRVQREAGVILGARSPRRPQLGGRDQELNPCHNHRSTRLLQGGAFCHLCATANRWLSYGFV